MKNKIVIFELTVVSVLLLSFTACEKKNISKEQKPEIKVAFAQDEGIESYVNEDGQLAGEEYEIWAEIAKRLPEYKFNFIATSQDDLRAGLQTGAYDASVGGFFLSRERIEKFTIPREPLTFTWTGVLIRKNYAEGIKSLEDLARKQKETGFTFVPQNSGSGFTYILEVYNEENPDNQIAFDLTAEQTWFIGQEYVGVGRYDATGAQKTDFETNFLNEEGAYHEYADLVSWAPVKNVGVYTLFKKDIDEEFTQKYANVLKEIKDEGIASEISKRVYGYDAYTEEYFDLVK